MPRYTYTYETTISVSVDIDLPDDDDIHDEDESAALVEEYLETLAIGEGPHRITADASVDGMGPARIVRVADGVEIYTETKEA